nr:MAG TPA: hypothetical protein [Caudoviricetes sp.]
MPQARTSPRYGPEGRALHAASQTGPRKAWPNPEHTPQGVYTSLLSA